MPAAFLLLVKSLFAAFEAFKEISDFSISYGVLKDNLFFSKDKIYAFLYCKWGA